MELVTKGFKKTKKESKTIRSILHIAHSIHAGSFARIRISSLKIRLMVEFQHYETDEMGLRGEPICVSTLSSHWRGP